METVKIYNCSKQLVSIQAMPEGGDFYLHEQQIHLQSGKDVVLPANCVRMKQLDSLRSKGMIKYNKYS